jgi:hypothetical protein
LIQADERIIERNERSGRGVPGAVRMFRIIFWFYPQIYQVILLNLIVNPVML